MDHSPVTKSNKGHKTDTYLVYLIDMDFSVCPSGCRSWRNTGGVQSSCDGLQNLAHWLWYVVRQVVG